MSLPPVTVQIKRKATDEPVDFLRVHEPNGKRQRRAMDFVFSRKAAPDPGHDSTTHQPTLEGVPGAEPAQLNANSISIPNNLIAQFSQAEPATSTPGNVAESRIPGNSSSRKRPADYDDLDVSLMPAQVRRFHMSRASPKITNSVSSGAIRKRAAVFVERKSHPSRPRESLEHQDQHHVGLEPSSTKSKLAWPQKKPGLAARLQAVPANDAANQNMRQLKPSAPRDVSLPSGLTMPWDVNSEQLAAEMQAYTLQEIGKNLAEAEATRPSAHLTTSSAHVKKAQSRFKPKKPALRYQERHPGQFSDSSSKMEIEGGFIDDEVDDDSDYVIDTYIRMPADDLVTSDSEKNFGLLVLDSQPDIDEFYLEDSDSDEPEDEDDDDENAENHYTADYPDDEVESDDEYGRNPCLYRNHNASDLEEFDEDDATFSDDETDAAKYPWTSRLWMRRPEDRGALLEDGQDK